MNRGRIQELKKIVTKGLFAENYSIARIFNFHDAICAKRPL